jgi:hypothetical protein
MAAKREAIGDTVICLHSSSPRLVAVLERSDAGLAGEAPTTAECDAAIAELIGQARRGEIGEEDELLMMVASSAAPSHWR